MTLINSLQKFSLKWFMLICFGLIPALISCEKKQKTNFVFPVEKNSPTYKLDSKNGCYLPAIIGGTKVDSNNDLKDHLLLLISTVEETSTKTKKNIVCTGSLISPNTVLSAAHCFSTKDKVLFTGVYASTDLWCSSGFNRNLIYPVTKISLHPLYKESEPNKNSPDYDIAVVRFSGVLPGNYAPIKISKLNPKTSFINNPQNLILTGYGRTSSTFEALPELRFVYKSTSQLVFTSYDNEMGKSYDLVSDLGLIGIAQDDARGVCHGDSGGPLLVGKSPDYEILGVASYIRGINCEHSNIYYTFTPNYADWINLQLQ